MAVVLPLAGCGKPAEILNVSYDPTRELYKEFSEAFEKHWKETTGQTILDQDVARRLGRPGP